MKISLLKSNIQTVVSLLNKLQMHRDKIELNPKNLSRENIEIEKCKESLESAFAILESASLNQITMNLKKRKKQRHKKKLKIKKKYGETTSSTAKKAVCQRDADLSLVSEKPTLSTLEKSKLRSSKKYLSSIECLETLHRLRGGGDTCKLKESLNSIKSFWQSTQHCIHDKLNNDSLAKHWDKVLFGGRSEIEVAPGLADFVEKRSIWDSYLDCSKGSHIPVGWVYPKKDAGSKWKEYLQLT